MVRDCLWFWVGIPDSPVQMPSPALGSQSAWILQENAVLEEKEIPSSVGNIM